MGFAFCCGSTALFAETQKQPAVRSGEPEPNKSWGVNELPPSVSPQKPEVLEKKTHDE
jgi:hypothetical protein